MKEAHLYRSTPQLDAMWADLLQGRLRPDDPSVPSQSALRLEAKLRELRDRSVLTFFAINGQSNVALTSYTGQL